MVSASVNDIWTCPYTKPCSRPWPGQPSLGQPYKPFPAYLNFPAKGNQVISTMATQLTDTDGSLDPSSAIDLFLYEERFRFQDLGTLDEVLFNYGLSNDRVNDPDEAFTDIGALGAYEDALTRLNQAEDILEIRNQLYKLYQIAGLSKDEALKDQFYTLVASAAQGTEVPYASSTLNTAL